MFTVDSGVVGGGGVVGGAVGGGVAVGGGNFVGGVAVGGGVIGSVAVGSVVVGCGDAAFTDIVSVFRSRHFLSPSMDMATFGICAIRTARCTQNDGIAEKIGTRSST